MKTLAPNKTRAPATLSAMPDPAHHTSVVIVSPALADANNGNWQTARYWRKILSPHFAVRIVRQWPDAAAGKAPGATEAPDF